jgi:hypothetical protein
VSYDLIWKFADLEKNGFKFLICDESHYIKSAEAKRTKALLALLAKSKRAVLLSGTPALSRPIELYTQVSVLQVRHLSLCLSSSALLAHSALSFFLSFFVSPACSEATRTSAFGPPFSLSVSYALFARNSSLFLLGFAVIAKASKDAGAGNTKEPPVCLNFISFSRYLFSSLLFSPCPSIFSMILGVFPLLICSPEIPDGSKTEEGRPERFEAENKNGYRLWSPSFPSLFPG